MNESQTFELTIYPGRMREEVLSRLSSLGIEDFIESAGEVNADDEDWELAFERWSAADDAPILVYRATRNELADVIEHLRQEFAGRIEIGEKFIADTLWQAAWEPDFESLETESFFIAPPSVSGGEGKRRLVLKEAAVFGSGQHATTQALVRLLERRPVDPSSGQAFLDVGTGTGVLAMVAHHLGYARLLGTDIEDNAIANAEENAKLNGLELPLLLGSLPPLGQKWEVIACNILPPTLTDLLKELVERLAPGGELYLAGFHEANGEAVRAELARLGFVVRDEMRVRGWLGWVAGQSEVLPIPS